METTTTENLANDSNKIELDQVEEVKQLLKILRSNPCKEQNYPESYTDWSTGDGYPDHTHYVDN